MEKIYKYNLAKFLAGFSLIEILIALIIISLITAAFIPILTKKVSKITVHTTSGLTTECSDKFSEDCSLCTEYECIMCSKNCLDGKYKSLKCECENCKDKYGACKTCNKDRCTLCEEGYYIKNGACADCSVGCPAGKTCFCDGITQNDSCDIGNYIQNNACKPCSAKFGVNCATCNVNMCTSCKWSYFLKDGSCLYCRTYNEAKNCDACTSERADDCISCGGGAIFDTDSSGNKICSWCSSFIPNCTSCENKNECRECGNGNFLNLSKKCQECSIDGCITCKNNVSSPQCTTCSGDKYLENNICKPCTNIDENCAGCSNGVTCVSCKQGYHLSDDKKSCLKNGETANCSDENFMQINNYCVTRKNMGDASLLSIPSTVTVVNVGENCYSSTGKCCWKGQTASYTCKTTNGDYSACNRTVCNYAAAKEICSKFNYEGKTWKLPNDYILNTFYKYSIGLGNDGFMMCCTEGYNTSKCYKTTDCKGSLLNECRPNEVWGEVRFFAFFSATWSKSESKLQESSAKSVRCISDL